jgi:hypothetical protein
VLARAQRSNGAQIILTTHSPELLDDEGIRADEVLLLTPTADGTVGIVLASDGEAVRAIESGLTVAEVALPRTAPPNIESLANVGMGRR